MIILKTQLYRRTLSLDTSPWLKDKQQKIIAEAGL